MYLVCDSLPMGEDSALQEVPKLALDESWWRTTSVAGPSEKRLELLRNDLVENGLVRSTGSVRGRGGASGSGGGVQVPGIGIRFMGILARRRRRHGIPGCRPATSAIARSKQAHFAYHKYVDFSGGGIYDAEPRQMPNLYHGMHARIYGRFDAPGPVALKVQGDIVGERFERTDLGKRRRPR